ncbi:uncharacterized protein LOC111582988 [Amphiprion ocellaris]|uniref:uncharacterized protein LOC111582988 n=1 Tax=Amphiprion ocellaris TaxID=80972 RepID=UPI000C306F5F|nr:uncharacterized protein LOC111582988 [Amphiprion ocellaris]
METPRREKYYLNVEFELEPEQTAAGRRHMKMHIINMRNRILTVKNLESLLTFVPSLLHRLTGEPDLSVVTEANGWARSPFFYEDEDMENARYCPLLEKPAQVMMTPAGFRPAAGRLLSPVHPDKTHIAVLKADRRNDILCLQQDDVSIYRVVSSVYSAAEEQVKGWFRLSDYTEDGQMTMSVMCYFPPEKKLKQDEPHKKRQKEETCTKEKLPEHLRL